MKRFINRERELAALNEQYEANGSSFVVIYGRRRTGKTTLIKEFIKDKRAFYFLANEESDAVSMKRFTEALSDFTGQEYLKTASSCFHTAWKTISSITTMNQFLNMACN